MIFLLSLARNPITSRLAVWVLVHFPALIPLHYLYLDKDILAFPHPRPTYPGHIIILPRQNLPNLASLEDLHGHLLATILRLAQVLARQHDLEGDGWQLVANAGPYQEVPHLHFHLTNSPEVNSLRENEL